MARILLSEGSSLSARQTLTVLGLAGHHVELMSSDPACLARFSRYCRKLHVTPAPGRDPDAYLEALLRIVRERRIEVLLPTHEQAYLLAAARHRLPPGLAVALSEFASFERVQSKAALSILLAELGVPQPPTRVLRGADDLPATQAFPVFAKSAYGTASAGVWRVNDRATWQGLAPQFQALGLFGDGLVIQHPVAGELQRTQAVFDRGRLVAIHAYRQLATGTGGGDVLKQSVRPAIAGLVERIGGALRWHGGLSFDYIVEDATGMPFFIDCNPRLVEPVNAWCSGVDMAGALVAVSRDQTPPRQPLPREGVKTRMGLMGLLAAAWDHRTRRAVLVELWRLMTRTGRYRGTIEELTPVRRDPLSLLPLLYIAMLMLSAPHRVERFSGANVNQHMLTPKAFARIKQWAAER
jgi:predicted ATP-grasp superfamily ATP-dependent carboligase